MKKYLAILFLFALPVYAQGALLHDSGVTPTHWVNTTDVGYYAGTYPYQSAFLEEPVEVTSVAFYLRNTSTTSSDVSLYYWFNTSEGLYFQEYYSPQSIPPSFEGFVSWDLPAGVIVANDFGEGGAELFVTTVGDQGVEMGYAQSDIDPHSEDYYGTYELLIPSDASYRIYIVDPPSTFHGEYLASSQEGFESATGFSMQSGVGFASENFLMLILGSGLALLMELIWWIIAIVVIALIIRFSYRAWKGVGVTNEKPSPKVRVKQRSRNTRKKKPRKKGHRHKKRA